MEIKVCNKGISQHCRWMTEIKSYFLSHAYVINYLFGEGYFAFDSPNFILN